MAAKIVISFDFELGWGDLDSDLWRRREYNGIYDKVRDIMPRLLGELKAREISTTWATVSNMLVDDEKNLNIDYLPEDYRATVLDFLDVSKKTSKNASDLIDGLLGNKKLFEVCSHTASHINARHPRLSSNVFVEDIRQSIDVLEGISGYSIDSVVFPRDYADFHLDVAQAFPVNMRLNPNFNKRSDTMSRLLRGVGGFFTRVPASDVIVGGMGEVYQTGSMYFNWIGGRHTEVKKILFMKNKQQLIKMLSRGQGTYHIWLHPCDFAENVFLFDVFLEWLQSISSLRERGVIEISTMSDIGMQCKILNKGW